MKKYTKTGAVLLSLALLTGLAACSQQQTRSADAAQETAAAASPAVTAEGGAAGAGDLFTDRDLNQTPDRSDAQTVTVSDGDAVTITEAGVYVLSGSAENAQIVVEADDEAKVQLVLDGLTVTNEDAPVIYVKNADKVFVTTAGENTLAVTGSFTADGDTNTDAVIFSKDDLVLNGTGTLTISSADNGVSCKDDLKVTGGTLVIDCASHGLEANDRALIAGGDITLTAKEGIEATYVLVAGGTMRIAATDDGINATQNTTDYAVCIEITGGDISITMAQGDTDALDSNGAILVSGGTVDITAQFAFDFDTTAQHTGGTITVNGETVDEITESMMMGGGMGGFGGPGQQGGMPGGGPGGGQGGPGGGMPGRSA